MGFDNECIPNIQSLAGEYFCPVCRQLVYPNEAIQTQCTHLYCKPCLTYIVSTTRACPYDGYLVTEADSKPLIESNKSVAEAIGRIPVYCLYHRSGCTWQGSFSECTPHCTSCPYGSSPVVCNRCGTQIVHRQVQEHAQNCPGTQPLQQDGGQAQATSAAAVEQNQTTAPGAAQTGGTTGQTAATQTALDQNQATANVQSQSTSVVPTPEQWYQQYQQYYQQYPQYQQHFQQYDQYQQHVQQYQAQLQAQPQQMVQGQPTAQPYLQPQPQSHPHVQPQGVPHLQQPHLQVNPQAQAHAHGQPPTQPTPQQQPQANQPQVQPQPQIQAQSQPQVQPQSQSQASQQPQVQAQGQALVQTQPLPQTQPQSQPQPQPLVQPQPQPQPQPQSQSQLHPQQQPQPQTQPHLLPQPQVLPQPQSQPHHHVHSHAPQQHPYPQPQVQAQAHQHAYPQPQLYANVQQQLPPAQPQHQQLPHLQGQPQPYAQSHLHPQHQPQMQHPVADPSRMALPVSGHQSYPQGIQTPVPQQHPQQAVPMHPQLQNASVQQHPMQMHAQQQPLNQSAPHQMPVPNQFPPQQVRSHHPPMQSHGPMQYQQQPAMTPMQMHHPHVPPPQQPPHMAPHLAGQPLQGHAYPGMHLPPQQQIPPQQLPMTQFHQQPQNHLQHPQSYSGQPPKMGHHQQQQQPPLFPQRSQQTLQAQQSLRPQGPSVVHQQSPAQVPLNHSVPPSQAVLPQQFPNVGQGAVPQHHSGRPMQNHGVQQQLVQQAPGGLVVGQDVRGSVRPVLPNANQQLSPTQNVSRTNLSLIHQQQQSSSLQRGQPAVLSVSAGSQSGANLNQALVATTMPAEKQQETIQDQASESPALGVKSLSADGMETDGSDVKHADIEESKVSKSVNDLDSLDAKEKESSDVGGKKVLSVEPAVSETSDSFPKLQKGVELHEPDDGSLYENASLKENASEDLLEPSDNGILPGTDGVGDGALMNDKDAQGEQREKVLPVDGEASERAVDSVGAKGADLQEKNEAEDLQKSEQSKEVNGSANIFSGPEGGPDLNKQTSGRQPLENAVSGTQAFAPISQGADSFHASQQHGVGDLDRHTLQHHPQTVAPVHEFKAPQTGLPERNLLPLSHRGVTSDDNRTMGHFGRLEQSKMQTNTFPQPAHRFPAPNERQPQPFPIQHGPPYGERAMQMQWPPLQPMPPHGRNLDGRFQEPPQHVPIHGQLPPGHRPQGPGPFQNLPQHGPQQIMPDHFQPPVVKQQALPRGSLNNEPNNFSGPPPPFGRGESSASLQKKFDLPSMPPPDYNQGYAFPLHAAGPKFTPGDPAAGPQIGPPHPGPFDPVGGTILHGPMRGPDSQLVRPPSSVVEQPDVLSSRRPGFVEGWQPDMRPPLSVDHPPLGQASGFPPGTGQPLLDERFKPLAGERFRPPQEEFLKPLSDEQFRPFPHDPAKRIIDRKEFEEDLKKFPRPGHLDGERGLPHDDYFLSSRHQGGTRLSSVNFDHSRNGEGGPHGFGRDPGLKADGAGVPPRSFGSFPGSSGGLLEVPPDVGGRFQPSVVPGDNLDRKADQAASRSDFLRPVQELGRPRLDSLPASRSPGRDYSGLSGRFIGGSPRVGSAGLSRSLEDFGGKEAHAIGEHVKSYNFSEDMSNSFHGNKPPIGAFDGRFPSFTINEPFGPGNLPIHPRRGDIAGHLRSGGDPLGGLPSHSRFGESPGLLNLPSHLRISESVGPGGLPSHVRFGEPFRSSNLPPHLSVGESFRGEGSYYNPLSRQHDMDPLDHPRKRKPGSMGWCRICQIDCETIEGLDLHSQTREHQKMAMDMVMSIKQDTAKKQKLSSEDRLPQDDTIRTKKSSFEGHGNRH